MVQAFDFTDPVLRQNNVAVAWFEGLNQMIAVYNLMAAWHKGRQNATMRAEYEAKRKFYRAENLKAQRRYADGRIAVPYAAPENVLKFPFDEERIRTPANGADGRAADSMASTTWSIFNEAGYNPMGIDQVLDLSISEPGSIVLSALNSNKPEFFGAAAGEAARTEQGLTATVINSGSIGWGSMGIDFKIPMDVSSTRYLIVTARGGHGGEKFMVTLRDRGWKLFDTVQASTDILPSPTNGLGVTAQELVIDLAALLKDPLRNPGNLDLTRLAQLAIEIGSATVGNGLGATVIVEDMRFAKSLSASSPLDPVRGKPFKAPGAAPLDRLGTRPERSRRPASSRQNPGFWRGSSPLDQKVERLLADLKNEGDFITRAEAAFSLGQISVDEKDKKEVVEALVVLTRDREAVVRDMVAWSLGNLAHPVALAALKRWRYNGE